MFSSEVVSLHIEGDSVRALVSSGRRVKAWATLPLEPGLVREGVPAHPEEVGTAIDQLLQSLRVKNPRLVVGLSGSHSTHRVLSFPSLPRKLLQKAVLQEASKVMPLSLEEAYFSWQPLSPQNGKQPVFALSVPRELLDAQVQALHQTGVKPFLMDLKPLALARAACLADALIVNVEADSLDIVLVVNWVPQAMRFVPLKSNSHDGAEKAKRVAEEVSKTLGYYQSSHNGKPEEPRFPLILTGQMAGDEALVRALEEEVGRPAEPFAPPLKYPPDFPLAYYAANVGLALKTVALPQARAINLNILPEVYRPPRPNPRRWALLIAPFLLSGLLWPSYQRTAQVVQEARQESSQMTRLTRQVQERRLREKTATEATRALEKRRAQVQALKASLDVLAQGRQAFVQTLGVAAQEALPPGVSLVRLREERRAGVGKAYETLVDIAGEAPDLEAVFRFSDNLKASRRFSQVSIDSVTAKETGVSFTIKALKS